MGSCACIKNIVPDDIMKKMRVAVFTGNRAEYGLQYPIIRALKERPNFECSLIVSGAHLDPNFGNTLEEIRKDGLRIDAEVHIQTLEDSRLSTSLAIGSGVLEITKALNDISPDMLIVYADRFEGFAATIAATQMQIATAHVEGGDLTEGGALDDSVRHAITKLSHLHFTTNQQATNRILAMGEEPWRVHTVGLPAIDMIASGDYASSLEVISRLNLDITKPIIVFTQHSITTEFEQVLSQLKPSLNALEKLAIQGAQIILTYPNNDAGGRRIVEELNKFAARRIPNIQLHPSLGRYLYHGVLALAKDLKNRVVCVGNSSSGVKETLALACPTVNIGSRQEGRLRGKNVVDVEYVENEILKAITLCLYDDKFRHGCSNAENPYGAGNAGRKIAEVLSRVRIDQKLIRKKMTLKGVENHGWFQ